MSPRIAFLLSLMVPMLTACCCCIPPDPAIAPAERQRAKPEAKPATKFTPVGDLPAGVVGP